MNNWKEILEKFGAPERVTDFSFSAGINRIATATVTYQPSDSNGRPIINEAGDGIVTLAENYVLVPRDLYKTLPKSFRKSVDQAAGRK